jgi:hypothetical protein
LLVRLDPITLIANMHPKNECVKSSKIVMPS